MAKKTVTVYVKGTDQILTYDNAAARKELDLLVVRQNGKVVARFSVKELKRWHIEPDS